MSVLSPTTTPSTHPPVPAAAAFAPLACCVLAVVGGVLLADDTAVEDVVDAAGFAGFPLVGGLLLRRGRLPRLGWTFAGIGLLLGFCFLAGGYADQDVPAAPVAELAATVAFVWLVLTLLTVVPLLFPDGHLPSRRWRPVAFVAGLLYPLAAMPVLLMPGPVDDDDASSPTNPIGVSGADDVLGALETATFVVFAVLALTCLSSLLLRLRGADPQTRGQVGTLSVGVGVLTGLFLLDSTLQGVFGDVYGILGAVLATSAVPVAAAVALLRGTVRGDRL